MQKIAQTIFFAMGPWDLCNGFYGVCELFFTVKYKKYIIILQ